MNSYITHPPSSPKNDTSLPSHFPYTPHRLQTTHAHVRHFPPPNNHTNNHNPPNNRRAARATTTKQLQSLQSLVTIPNTHAKSKYERRERRYKPLLLERRRGLYHPPSHIPAPHHAHETTSTSTTTPSLSLPATTTKNTYTLLPHNDNTYTTHTTHNTHTTHFFYYTTTTIEGHTRKRV